MAIKNLIARGVGFSPASIKFMPTGGLTPTGVVIAQTFCLKEMKLWTAGAQEANAFIAGPKEQKAYVAGAEETGGC